MFQKCAILLLYLVPGKLFGISVKVVRQGEVCQGEVCPDEVRQDLLGILVIYKENKVL